MISESLKKQYKKWGILVTIGYLLCFGFLKTYKFQNWILSPFIESIIGVFMGAGAIAVITGVILIFQKTLESEQKKKEEVFKEKLSLYKNVIDKMHEAFRIKNNENMPKLSSEERDDLRFTLLNVALLSKPKTFKLYCQMLADIADQEGNIKNNAIEKFLEFVLAAREDLDVQEEMTAKDHQVFDSAVKIAKEETEEIVAKFKPQYFNDFDDWIKKLQTGRLSNQEGKKKIKGIKINNHLRDILKSIIDFSKNLSEDVTNNYSYEASTWFINNGKYLHFKPWNDKELEILLLRDPENNWARPIVNGIEAKNRSGFESYYRFFISNKDYKENEQKFQQLIKRSYEIQRDGKRLNKKEVDINEIQDLTYEL